MTTNTKMGVYADSWATELLVLVSAAVLTVYVWFWHGCQYWKNKGVPYVQPSFPFGNVGASILAQKDIGHVTRGIHEAHEGKRFVGFYSFRSPVLLVRDPELLRHIFVKDASVFLDRGLYVNKDEPLMRQLFFMDVDDWKPLRNKLTPAFSSGKLKAMFKIIQDCGRHLASVVEEEAAHGKSTEVRDLMARYTTDVIVSIGFGIDSNCLRDPNATFRNWGRAVFNPKAKNSLCLRLTFVSPKIAKFLNMKGSAAEISRNFREMIAETVSYREKNNVSRKDFMDLLIKLKNRGHVDDDKNQENKESMISMDVLSALSYAFFVAGYETSTTTISSALHELALHPDVQNRVHQEIDLVLSRHGEITYDAIGEMAYLDNVVSETLRKYPALPILNRRCMEDYRIPDSEVVLEKGTDVHASLLGLHYDPEHFPDPERFDPERFSEKERAKRHHYAYMPFGEGPRNCIGVKLGRLQTKVGLVNVLSKHSVLPTDETKAKLTYSGRTVLLFPKNGIILRFQRRI